jgi:spermidine/putrescine transport system ATP-binding protein
LTVVIRSILFDGANSRLLAVPSNAEKDLVIALPQNRQFDHLSAGDRIEIGWHAGSTICFADPKNGSR